MFRLMGVARMSGQPGGGFSPLSLFAAGEQGLWYDPSDFSSMFQDSAGTTPVTAVGQPVGRINDKSGRGNHATQATAAARPVVSARKNLLTSTASFTDFAEVAVTKSSGIAAPDGTLTATKITPAATSGFHYLQGVSVATLGVVYCRTLYLQANGYSTAFVSIQSDSYLLTIDIDAVSILSTPWGVTASIEALPDGWVKVVAYAASLGATFGGGIGVGTGSFSGDGSSGINVWHPQNEVGTVSTAYQRVTTASDYDTSGFPHYLAFDGIDDELSATFPDLGTDVTIARSVPYVGTTILTGQTVGAGTWTDSTNHSGLVIIDRSLTAGETAALTAYFDTKAGVYLMGNFSTSVQAGGVDFRSVIVENPLTNGPISEPSYNNAVWHMGWNTAGGVRSDASKPMAEMAFEGKFYQSGTFAHEYHIQGQTACGAYHRWFSMFLPQTTEQAASGAEWRVAYHNFFDTSGANRVIIDTDRKSIDLNATAITQDVNAVQFIKQKNADGSGFVTLLYLDEFDRARCAAPFYIAATPDAAFNAAHIMTVGDLVDGSSIMYAQGNNIVAGNLYAVDHFNMAATGEVIARWRNTAIDGCAVIEVSNRPGDGDVFMRFTPGYGGGANYIAGVDQSRNCFVIAARYQPFVSTDGTDRLVIDPSGNVGIRGLSPGGGAGVVFIANATTAPTADPSGGGCLYVENGALKYRGSAGTVTVLGAA